MWRLVNFVAFYVIWVAGVVGAADGRLWLGPVLGGVFVLAHLGFAPDPREEARLVIVIGWSMTLYFFVR